MVKNAIGIVCSRAGSKRLKHKNRLIINGKSLAIRAVEQLKAIGLDTVHLTDIEEFLCEENAIRRPENLNDGHVPLQDVVVWYLREKVEGIKNYKTVVLLMATNPWITYHDIEKALMTYLAGDQKTILRSYNASTGEENGLYIMDVDYVLSNDYHYDVHTRAIFAPGMEIHTAKDFKIARESLEFKD